MKASSRTVPSHRVFEYVHMCAYGLRACMQAYMSACNTQNHAVVLPDANKDLALSGIIGAAFGAAGQVCVQSCCIHIHIHMHAHITYIFTACMFTYLALDTLVGLVPRYIAIACVCVLLVPSTVCCVWFFAMKIARYACTECVFLSICMTAHTRTAPYMLVTVSMFTPTFLYDLV